jgi:hypothetical protein
MKAYGGVDVLMKLKYTELGVDSTFIFMTNGPVTQN